MKQLIQEVERIKDGLASIGRIDTDINVPNNDLISRQAAIDALFKKWDTENGVTWIPLDHIEQLPSSQPEIIRCKDCLMHGVCRFERGLGLYGYCSQAERRADG